MDSSSLSRNARPGLASMAEPASPDDLRYSSLKKNHKIVNQKSQTTLKSSFSMERLRRELSPLPLASKKNLQKDNAENEGDYKNKLPALPGLIHDPLEEQEILDQLKKEVIPGSCKSHFALQYRLESDKANLNF